jgi:hypothetical protein
MKKPIKQIKKELGIKNADIAKAFGYVNANSYATSTERLKRITLTNTKKAHFDNTNGLKTYPKRLGGACIKIGLIVWGMNYT